MVSVNVGTRVTDPRWTGIAVAWALTGILHLFTFAWMAPPAWEGWAYLAATVILLLRPAVLWRLVLFWVVTGLVFVLHYPRLSNHLVLEFWLVVALLIAAGCRAWGTGRVTRRGVLYDCVAPIVRTHYVLLFAFAFAAKLNRDFLNPESSCAAYFLSAMADAYFNEAMPVFAGWVQSWPVVSATIGLTLALEGLIPVLLVIRSTRRVGIILAIFFHLTMGVVPILGISSFSALSLVLLLFFFSDASLVALNGHLCRLGQWIVRTRAREFFVIGWLLVGFFAALVVQLNYFHPDPEWATLVWLVMSAPFVWLMLCVLWRTPTPPEGVRPGAMGWMFANPRPLNLLSIPVFLLGLTPYLGLQTQGAFTMFSNLRVLGEQPNHLLASDAWLIQRPELIRIVSTNHPGLEVYAKRPRLITDHELRRTLSADARDFFVVCEFRDEVIWLQRYGGLGTPHPLLEPLPFFQRHFIRYKPVSALERNPCAW